MTHEHSKDYPFQLERDGRIYECCFVITDDRLLTVTAAGKKRTEGLGSTPPRALAIAVATQLVREHEAASRPPAHHPSEPHKGWIDKLLDQFGAPEPAAVHS
jgi:hypothetical protein